jgi:hypothetical protein
MKQVLAAHRSPLSEHRLLLLSQVHYANQTVYAAVILPLCTCSASAKGRTAAVVIECGQMLMPAKGKAVSYRRYPSVHCFCAWYPLGILSGESSSEKGMKGALSSTL